MSSCHSREHLREPFDYDWRDMWRVLAGDAVAGDQYRIPKRFRRAQTDAEGRLFEEAWGAAMMQTMSSAYRGSGTMPSIGHYFIDKAKREASR